MWLLVPLFDLAQDLRRVLQNFDFFRGSFITTAQSVDYHSSLEQV
jgi:hypothetical protein